MADLILPYTLVPGTDAKADDVQGNDDALALHANTEVVHRDGSKAFTALPSAPSSENPSSDGHLVTKGALDRRSSVLFYQEFTTNGQTIQASGTYTWCGFSHNFSMPAIPPGGYFTVEAYVPMMELIQSGGNWPQAFYPIDVGLFLSRENNHTRIQNHRQPVNGGRGFTPQSQQSFELKRVIRNNGTFTAGVTYTMNLRARFTISTQGGFRLVGQPSYPIGFIGKMGG